MDHSSPSPLRQPLFAALWLAATFSYIGSFVHLTAASWLMMDMNNNPLWPALIQTADYFPFFLFILPAGALADRVKLKPMLMSSQIILMLAVAVITFLVHTDLIRPLSLLGLTAVIGVASAFNSPAWQMTILDIASKEAFPTAITLNSLGYNLARTVGPALGGILIGLFGLTVPFAVDTVSFLAVIAVICFWKEKPMRSEMIRKMQEKESTRKAGWFSGVQYSYKDPYLRWLFTNSFLFSFMGSGIWSLLAPLARYHLHTTALGYGILFGSMGSGAVLAGLVLLRFRERWSNLHIIRAGILVYALAMMALALAPWFPISCVCCLFAGMAWLSSNTSFNITAQNSVPHLFRGRIYAVYSLLSNGGLALGGVVFGKLAENLGSQNTLWIPGIILLLTWYFICHRRMPARRLDDLDGSGR